MYFLIIERKKKNHESQEIPSKTKVKTAAKKNN